MNVYNEAHNLAEAIKQAEEFKEYDRLRREIDADPEVSSMIHDFEQRQVEMQTKQMMGETVTLTDAQAEHFVHDRMNVGDGTNEGRMRRQDAYIESLKGVMTDKVKEDVHYAVKKADITAYEEKYGPIPDGAFVALRTDWSKNWPDMDRLSGIADDGSENSPGWSMEALTYIYEERNAAANGHETLDTDASAEAAKAEDLACERYVLDSGKLQVEVLDNLDKVAPAGALILVMWPRIEGATGLPVRAVAITPKQ